jgi:hypothetical protein
MTPVAQRPLSRDTPLRNNREVRKGRWEEECRGECRVTAVANRTPAATVRWLGDEFNDTTGLCQP